MRMFRGDLKPDLSITCYDGADPVNLSTASTVKVIGVRDGVALFNRAATSAGADGVVTMEWQAGDTSTVGQIAVEVEVTWPGGKPQTFRPAESVKVEPDLG